MITTVRSDSTFQSMIYIRTGGRRM